VGPLCGLHRRKEGKKSGSMDGEDLPRVRQQIHAGEEDRAFSNLLFVWLQVPPQKSTEVEDV